MFGVVLFVTLGTMVYMLLGKGAEQQIVEQVFLREQTVTKAGAVAIESFLTLAGRSLALVGENDTIQNFKPGSEAILKRFVQKWKGTSIVGVSVANDLGVVNLTVNQDGTKAGEGVSIADRDYFSRAKASNDEQIIIGNAVISRLGQSKGHFVAPLIASMHDEKGKFLGVVVSSTILEELTKYYVEPLKISDRTGVYLVADDGTILYSSFGPEVEENLPAYIRKHPFLGSEVIAKKVEAGLKKGEGGKLDLVIPTNRNQPWTWKHHLLAYSPINIGEGRYWYVALTTPVDDARQYMGPIYVRIVGTYLVVFLALLGYAVWLAKRVAYKQASKDEHEEHGVDK